MFYILCFYYSFLGVTFSVFKYIYYEGETISVNCFFFTCIFYLVTVQQMAEVCSGK